MDLDVFFIIILFFVYQSIVLPGKCIDELNYAKESKWFENFGFLANIEVPNVPRSKTEYSRKSVAFTVFKILEIVIGSWSLWSYWESKYWFWGLGYSLGKLLSNIFVGIDIWADLGLITPTPAHIRYLEI